ncbi:anti-sigma B factor antagonist [Nonomuraea solani]|uniref:Anti-sigma factor antagonist n=1 Tax=Nonomuraea solani TaxID=1144553 RepID=A0A1H6F1Y5_9ACTN|nr:STAS domain-containing protein [Nonomuraea solani]SEH04082.1 anti-sigma B factor antagonist [Nonomuraea solani]
MPPLRMHHEHHPGATVIALAGELDLATAPALHHFVHEVRRRPADHLIFDMADVAFVDSSGLRVLLDAYTVAHQFGGAIHLTALSGAPARLIEVTKLDERFRLHTTTANALAAILAGPGRPAPDVDTVTSIDRT